MCEYTSTKTDIFTHTKAETKNRSRHHRLCRHAYSLAQYFILFSLNTLSICSLSCSYTCFARKVTEHPFFRHIFFSRFYTRLLRLGLQQNCQERKIKSTHFFFSLIVMRWGILLPPEIFFFHLLVQAKPSCGVFWLIVIGFEFWQKQNLWILLPSFT